ncbi:MAG: hypothetical protein AAFR93_00955 [Pseudomonadota bacterium]
MFDLDALKEFDRELAALSSDKAPPTCVRAPKPASAAPAPVCPHMARAQRATQEAVHA